MIAADELLEARPKSAPPPALVRKEPARRGRPRRSARPSPPSPAAARITREEALLTDIQRNPKVKTVEDVHRVAEAYSKNADGDAGAIATRDEIRGEFTHTTDRKVIVWKDDPNFGARRIEIPYPNLIQALDSGAFHLACPDCGDDCGPGYNCPVRGTPQYRVCQVCGKEIRDPGDHANFTANLGDPALITGDEDATRSTPETRTQVLLDAHYANSHPTGWAAIQLARRQRAELMEEVRLQRLVGAKE